MADPKTCEHNIIFAEHTDVGSAVRCASCGTEFGSLLQVPGRDADKYEYDIDYNVCVYNPKGLVGWGTHDTERVFAESGGRRVEWTPPPADSDE